MTIDATKTIVLITGANRGIGFEIVKALLKAAPSSPSPAGSGAPYHVFLGSRDVQKGKTAAGSLTTEHGNSVSVVQLDGNSSESIAAAVSSVKAQTDRIDVLINNAGVLFAKPDKVVTLREILETNLIGAYAVSEAFQPLLVAQAAQKKDKRIINVSSDLGSITWRYDPNEKHYKVPGTAYRISKTGMNMMTACQAADLKDLGVKAFSFNPGFTATELNGPIERRRQNGAWEADVPAAACVEIVAGKRDQELGKMLEVGGTVPW